MFEGDHPDAPIGDLVRMYRQAEQNDPELRKLKEARREAAQETRRKEWEEARRKFSICRAVTMVALLAAYIVMMVVAYRFIRSLWPRPTFAEHAHAATVITIVVGIIGFLAMGMLGIAIVPEDHEVSWLDRIVKDWLKEQERND